MSSAAAKRTSTGKPIRSPLRARYDSISARTCGTASRGTAYSISRNFTVRGEANTR